MKVKNNGFCNNDYAISLMKKNPQADKIKVIWIVFKKY